MLPGFARPTGRLPATPVNEYICQNNLIIIGVVEL